ncbi:MAG TPA: hypothetical protein VJB95_03025 [Candidatus Paceibacterota bacterium]
MVAFVEMTAFVIVWTLAFVVAVYAIFATRVLWVWRKESRRPEYQELDDMPWERWQWWVWDRYMDGEEDESTFSQFIVAFPPFTPVCEFLLLVGFLLTKVEDWQFSKALPAGAVRVEDLPEEVRACIADPSRVQDDDAR